ncbi:unnamed protein product [Arctia plantaginis]|uniref:Peptidase S1 domain-containing protein n=1 Tax=Arctia plantaginis TaxID=874455 RepID=A0A8S0ZYV5_ARCPL|nr:unnamed protein product [Arctia plantaginis]
MSIKLAVILIFIGHVKVKSQFHECHNDPDESPENGILYDPKFSWLGALQYIHVKTGAPHYFRVPRVVLISRQFVLSTAADAAEIPYGYALGNVAFADYYRDEIECGLTVRMVADGKECDPAILLIPIADVLLHPEYKHFDAKNSLALLKLVKPVKSYVPRDFSEEEKEVKRIVLLPKELCFMFDPSAPENSTRITRNRMMCTTGCGFHSGAPTLIHEHTGHWSIVSMAIGGNLCPDPLRARRPPAPPLHIIIYPYVSWITAAISGKPMGAFAKDDPFGFVMPRAGHEHPGFGHHWLGHWYMGGIRCFDRGHAADDMFKFYHEIFNINVDTKGLNFITYGLEIFSEPLTIIVCVKVGMPYRLTTPIVHELMKAATKVSIPVIATKQSIRFQIEAWGFNVSSHQSMSQPLGGSFEYE